MENKTTDLVSLFEKTLSDIAEQNLDEIGFVVQVSDLTCRIHGLLSVVYGELVEFEGGNKGIVFDLQEDTVVVFLLYQHIAVGELEVVKRTNKVLQVPVGQELLGRVVNAIGKPLDGLGDIATKQRSPVEAKIPGIVDRAPISESLETGIMVIDALIPIGKGQRELIIGNRSTGKTSIALETIMHQKGKKVICVYVSIGQRAAHVARLVRVLEEHDCLSYTIIVSADASDSPLNRYLAPYAGCTIAEYFRDRGQDALIVYDDLSNHAVAYREMSLLMRRSPGREAYPGDIFYLHSRLLERAGKLLHGGSLTALPIVQIQGDDLAAYIPTNLISITDGQLFLDTKLFNAGIRPAVNVELSVSRVGGAAKTSAMKGVTRSLSLELAQYHELLGFSQFGTELDVSSQKQLARGSRIVALLKQQAFQTYSFVDQVLMLFLLKEHFLEQLPEKKVKEFALSFVDYITALHNDVYQRIYQTGDFSTDDQEIVYTVAKDFTRAFGGT